MRKDKIEAIKLRRKGFSYNEITGELNIPKSTLSCWLSSIKLSEKAKERIAIRVYDGSVAGLIRRNKNQTLLAQNRAREIKKIARGEVSKLSRNKLFLTGVSLYWAEGYKKGAYGSKWKAVDFANSDPDLVKIMMKFFRKFCNVEDKKIKIQLMAHPNVNVKKAIDYWSNVTDIPRTQFTKTCYKISKRSKRKRNPRSLIFGTVHIRICDVKLFFRIIGWINGVKEVITK